MTAALTQHRDWPTPEQLAEAMAAKGERASVPVVAAVLEALWAYLLRERAGREERE